MANNKEYDFIVTLKPPDYKYLNIISILMCMLAVTVSVYSLIYASFFYTPLYIALILDIFIIAFLAYNYFLRKGEDKIIIFRWALTAAAILWCLPPYNNLLIGLLYLFASFIERQIKLPQEIAFDKEEISINSFPSKHYEWQQIQNVVIKDNLLTIDFRNNKILQKETESDVSIELENEFNAFCALQLKHSNADLHQP